MRGKVINDKKAKGGKRYFIDRGGVRGFVEVTAKEYKAAFPDKPIGQFATHSSAAWPQISLGCGVDPSQIKEAEAVNKKNGDNVTYVASGENAGDAIFNSRTQKRKHMKNIAKQMKGGKLHPKNSYYD